MPISRAAAEGAGLKSPARRRPAFLCFLAVSAVLLEGCATAPRKTAVRPDPAKLTREAGEEIGRGCYRCLRSAAEKYEAAIAAGGRGLDAAASGAWALVEARERELGLRPSDSLDRARAHFVGPDRAVGEAYVRIAAGLPRLNEGVSIEAASEASRAGRDLVAMLAASPTPPLIKLIRERARAGEDRVAAYLSQSMSCFWLEPHGQDGAHASLTTIAAPREPPSGLSAYLSAICPSAADPKAAERLAQLVQGEPRFHEAHYFLGRLSLRDKKLASAEREFLAAADGLPSMAAAWAMLGVTRLALEEYEWAAADLARALRIEPDQRGALLALAQALNYAGRFEEALAPSKRLVEMGEWYVSDANYWLAFSELQLGRLQDADRHAREAKRTNPMNGDTARLSGLVAERLADFDRARTEFERAISQNPADCESHLHLGQVHGRQKRFGPAVDSFTKARDCYSGLVEASASRQRAIGESSLPKARQEAMAARLAQRVRGYRGAQATASLGAAEAEVERGGFDKALAHLADAAAESSSAGRVREMRARIAALRARP